MDIYNQRKRPAKGNPLSPKGWAFFLLLAFSGSGQAAEITTFFDTQANLYSTFFKTNPIVTRMPAKAWLPFPSDKNLPNNAKVWLLPGDILGGVLSASDGNLRNTVGSGSLTSTGFQNAVGGQGTQLMGDGIELSNNGATAGITLNFNTPVRAFGTQFYRFGSNSSANSSEELHFVIGNTDYTVKSVTSPNQVPENTGNNNTWCSAGFTSDTDVSAVTIYFKGGQQTPQRSVGGGCVVASAIQGIQGISGPDGKQGPQGIAGPQGPIGPVGPMGPVGPTGQKGQPGDPGAKGPDGNQGPPGIEGPEGPQGLAGVQGQTGLPGQQGGQGIQGLPGPQGPTGPVGPAGPAGAPGPDGREGPQGGPGNVGDQGPQGVQGVQGVRGVQGLVGPTGPQGAQGPAGPQGPMGPPYASPPTNEGPFAVVQWRNDGVMLVWDGMTSSQQQAINSPQRTAFWNQLSVSSAQKAEIQEQALGQLFVSPSFFGDTLMTMLDTIHIAMSQSATVEGQAAAFRPQVLGLLNQGLKQIFASGLIKGGTASFNPGGLCQEAAQGLQVWMQPMAGTKHDSKLRGNFEGALLGLQYRGSLGLIGLMGGFGHQNARLLHQLGKKKANSGYTGMYFTFAPQRAGLIFQQSVVLSFDRYQDIRQLPALDSSIKAVGKSRGHSVSGETQMSYLIEWAPQIRVHPFVSFSCAYISQGGYDEQGTGLFDLHVPKASHLAFREEVGIGLEQAHGLPVGKVDTLLQVSYLVRHSPAKAVRRNFLMDPTPFTLAQSMPTKLYGGFLASARLHLSKGWMLQALTKGEFAHREWQAKFMLDLRKSF